LISEKKAQFLDKIFMNKVLQRDKNQFNEILAHTLELAEVHFAHENKIPPGRFIQNLDRKTIPQKGIGAVATLDYFQQHYASQLANSAGPNYFGFVTGGSTPASVAADWLVSLYDQNACGSNDSIAPQLENQTIDFFKQIFGLDDDYFGSFVTGATVSNFVNLAIARQWVGEQQGIDVSNDGFGSISIQVVSATPHSSILKSMSMSGIGRNALVKIDMLPDREAIDLQRLEEFLAQHQAPCIVVANAGTVNTVDFDDLVGIGELKRKYNFWVHVDAAFGGFAAISKKFAHLMNGINFADSITIDAHKWLNVPYDAAMQFTRHKRLQLKVFQNSAAYLGDPEKSPDYFHYTPENSRRFRALPSWFTLMAYGKEGHAEIVERNCECATQFGNWVNDSSDFKLLAPVRMNVVCFAPKDDVSFATIQEFLKSISEDGRVFFTPTIYKGTPAIRMAISNWQTIASNIDLAITALTEVWDAFKKRQTIVSK
jgi:glutamate/tyrosine decarboxylase-like PLP-dependent enzyme